MKNFPVAVEMHKLLQSVRQLSEFNVLKIRINVIFLLFIF